MKELYIAGTILEVGYKHDGITERQQIILANTFEKGKLFQVIAISGYHAGEIEGYIPYQFNDENINCCTMDFIEEQLKEYVFGELLSVELTTSRRKR